MGNQSFLDLVLGASFIVQFVMLLLLAMIEKFDGGPVGVDSLAAAISEERGTIEDVLEPFLIQQGYILRTPRGRMVTRAAYLQFGLQPRGALATPDLLAGAEGGS